ncbi:MAG: hypothetical protein ACRDHI_00995 [Actinomycetota bacterium]
MAIKGKRKSRPRAAPRAPRREPVAVPVPFVRRRWVQVVAAFLLGVGAMTLFVVITNAVRDASAESEASARASDRRAAATGYRAAVQAAFGQVGVVNPGVPPTVFVEMDAALDGLSKGKPPLDAAATFRSGSNDAVAAAESLASFAVADAVRDKGFEPLQVAAFTGSAAQLGQALDLYGKAARVAGAALDAEGAAAARLTKVAVELRDTARTQLAETWNEYLAALRAGGVNEGPATDGLVPELPGGGG